MAAKYGDWTRGEDEALLNKLGGVEVARGILRGTIEFVTKVVSFITHTFTVLVDETQSVEEVVESGKFDWTNDEIISKNFPQVKDGKKSEKEVVLFHFKKDISSEDVIKEMDEAGFKPGTIWDLLGLALKEPNLQKEFPIVALGSVCRFGVDRGVPYLVWSDGRRYLDLRWFDHDWGGRSRFVGVRK